MKKIRIIIAAALALSLTACSFFNKDNLIDDENVYEGTFQCEVTLEGGSGRATVESPAEVVVTEDSKTVRLEWSSSHYDYMVVDSVRYDNEAAEGDNSVFTIPFSNFDESFGVIGDTTVMSTPHEIEYVITVYTPGTASPQSHSFDETLSTKSTDEVSLPEGLVKSSSLPLKYATQFSVDYYKDKSDNNFAFITIGTEGSAQYFLYGNGASKISGLSDEITPIESVDKTYLVSTSVMDLISSIGALDSIRLSGTNSKDWYIPDARAAMEQKDILYAGKYSAPDYELLVTEGCNFAIENTMIYHNPSVKEKLEALGIPVLVERSSYENNPLARLEWIKLYGILYNRLDEATEFFSSQESRVKKVEENENTGLKVAVFSISSNGQVVVRRPGDYVSTMVEIAGGNYVPADLKSTDDSLVSTMKITMEDFYLQAADTDVLLYNSTIEGELSSVSELIAKSEILADFKAVKNHRVYCIEKSYFQRTGDVAELIEDIHSILAGEASPLTYIYKLED